MNIIIITGVAGYIGSQLAFTFDKKFKIIGIDDFSNSTKKNNFLYSFTYFKFYKKNIDLGFRYKDNF